MSAPPHPTRPHFSLIVPTLNEEEEIGETLRRAKQGLGPKCEILVVDGGSQDRTVAIASEFGRVLASEPSRGGQSREGAAQAEGEILVFLHADTWLEDGAGDAIRSALTQGAGAGCLQFVTRPENRDPRYRLLERGVNWRTRMFATATGDQVIFATRDVYDRAGGMPDIPLFEDVTFVKSVRKIGGFFVANSRALTSRRRWERSGFFRTLLTHWFLRAAHAFGIEPARLNQLYRRRVEASRAGVRRC